MHFKVNCRHRQTLPKYYKHSYCLELNIYFISLEINKVQKSLSIYCITIDKWLYLYNQIPCQGINITIQELSSCPFQINSRFKLSVADIILIFLSILKLHINWIIQCVLFYKSTYHVIFNCILITPYSFTIRIYIQKIFIKIHYVVLPRLLIKKIKVL